ncbi:hypothetical protein P4B35_08370 [Pontiellaceae bacterium B12227]|nr:hypothetical protein [Pontiellaceae bacterium B12227]
MKKISFVLTAGLMVAAGAAYAAGTETVTFDTRVAGKTKSIKTWGIDATWVNYHNASASRDNAGDQIDFIRIGFYLHEPYNDDGSLSSGQIAHINKALKFVNMVDKKKPVMLSPNNMKGIIDWYKKSDGSADLDRWYNVMLKTREYVETKGYKVVALEVFNEPDWKSWNMGKQEDLNNLFKRCEDWGVLRVGPATLSTTSARSWYGAIRKNIDSGGTHTLGGTMAEYIDFIRLVKKDRKHFKNPEVHALVEVIVGAEYGMDSVCWWDQINVGRAAFMKASLGKRIAYECVEENWSAACVYRGPDDVLYGFASTNERTNGKPTRYKFVCKNEDVTYCLNGNTDEGEFREKGKPFWVTAKDESGEKKTITKWFTIIPGKIAAPERRRRSIDPSLLDF